MITEHKDTKASMWRGVWVRPEGGRDPLASYATAWLEQRSDLADTGRLEAFVTGSPFFHSPEGTAPGMTTAEAEQRERQQPTPGGTGGHLGSAIGLDADTQVVLGLGGHGTSPGPTVLYIASERNAGGVGLLGS
jgi:hypothetical protein